MMKVEPWDPAKFAQLKGVTFGGKDVDILPFDLECIAGLKEGAIHIWHGRMNGEQGVYATTAGKSYETHLVMK